MPPLAAPPQAAPQSPPVEQLDEASREEEAWKFVLAKQDDKLVADFLKEFPNSKYVNEAKSRKRYMDRRVVLGLIILFGMVVGAVFGTAGAFLGVPEGIIGLFVGLGVGFLGTVFTVIPINALFFGDPDKALKQQEQKFLKKP